jgi:tetratricopeptide (TPR) repeat protein
LGRTADAEAAYAAGLRIDLDDGNGIATSTALYNLARCYADASPARSIAARELGLEVAEASRDQEDIATSYLGLAKACASAGLFERAEAAYEAFWRFPTPRNRAIYRIGDREHLICLLRFLQGRLTDQLLDSAEPVAEFGNNRFSMRDLSRLRGELALQGSNPRDAVASFVRYIEMTRSAGISATNVEARLALALARKGELERARRILDDVRELAGELALAELYLELGDREKARRRALAGYKWAWADGPEYSHWWELKRCRAVLAALGEPEPKLPAYDPKTAEPIPYEVEVRALIAKLKKQT